MAVNRDFVIMVQDIISHPEFQKTKDIIHHGKSNNVYTHSVATAHFAYRIAKRLDLSAEDTASITRAALLHDFVGYDWRDGKPDNIKYRGLKRIWHSHLFEHGFSAARNASFHFELTDRQRDAIRKHMFPLVPMLPKYKEGWIVTYCDKVVAAREMFLCVTDKIQPLFERRRPAFA